MKFIKFCIVFFSCLSILSCACKDLQRQNFITADNFNKNRWKKDTVYILFDEAYVKKEKYSVKLPNMDLDSIKEIHYTIKKEGIDLEWKHHITYFNLADDGFYLRYGDSAKTVESSKISPAKIIHPSLLVEMEHLEISYFMHKKAMFILEKVGNCKYRKTPVNFFTGPVAIE